MTKIKRIAFIAIILLAVGVIGILLTYHQNSKTISMEKTITQNFTGLDVYAGNENIEIIPTKATVTKVQLTGKTSSDYMQDYTMNVRGSTLYIKLDEQQVKFYNFNFSIFKPLALKIYVPEKQFESFVVQNDNGEIKTGNLCIKNLQLSTNNGGINITNTTAANVDVQSDNGVITFQGTITGKISGGTNNGKISLSVPSINYPIQLKSDNGSISVQTDKEPDNVTYDVHVDNGSINIFNKYTGSAVVGNGGNLIKLTTNNGKITIHQ